MKATKEIKKAVININYMTRYAGANLKGRTYQIVEVVGNRTTLNISGRHVDFYNEEVIHID